MHTHTHTYIYIYIYIYITKNYKDINLIAMAAKFFNTPLLNRIQPEIEKIMWKNQNVFQRNRLTTSHILNIHRITKEVCEKISR